MNAPVRMLDAQAALGFVGIAVADKSRDEDQFDVGEVGGFIRKGTVWVTAAAAVTPASTVYFVPATGVITGDAAAGANTAIANAVFETSAGAGELARVYLG